MIVTLALVVLCLRVGSVEENDIRWSESRKRVYSIFEDNSHMNRMWESKCRLTQVEQHIHDYKRNGSMLHLPRLRDLKARYPGDTFTLTQDNACDDSLLAQVRYDDVGVQFGILMLMLTVLRFAVYLSLRFGAKSR